MDSIWQYISTSKVWKPILVIVSSFSFGFSFKELATWILRKYHDSRERRRDIELINYLIRERESCPTEENAYGQPVHTYYRSSVQIAEATGRSAVEVRQRVLRLEQTERVERLAPKADAWTVTSFEWHDSKRH